MKNPERPSALDPNSAKRADKLDAVINTLVDGLILIGSDGSIQIFNKACERLFGYEASEVIGRNVRMLMPEPYHAEHDGYLTNYLSTGERRIIGIGREVAARRKDGTDFPILLSVGETRFGGEITFIGIIRDITTQKTAEQKLEMALSAQQAELESRIEAERRSEAIMLAAPAPMIAAAPNGRIALANNAAEMLFGYDRETLLTMNVDQLVPDEFRPTHAAHRQKYLEAPQNRAMGANRDLFARHANGRLIPVEVGLAPIDNSERQLVVASFIDLTERISAQETLREHVQALERSNRDLDDFAYAAAHDLRAPLRAIDQLARFVEEDSADALTEESRADLATLRQRVQRMQNLMTGLLNYSRIGRDAHRAEVIDTRAMLEEIAEMYLPDDTFTLDVAPDIPEIKAPRDAVELVFRNLLMNSVKHHDHSTGLIRITGERRHNGISIAVEDDGPGIPSKFADRIFKVFQTLKSRDDHEATGIGLALVMKTMTSLGGTVHLAESPGRGARFELWWPELTAKNVGRTLRD